MERRGPRRGVIEGEPLPTPAEPEPASLRVETAPPPTASETGHASEVALHERWTQWVRERRKFEVRENSEPDPETTRESADESRTE
jgi:hypothetical protein